MEVIRNMKKDNGPRYIWVNWEKEILSFKPGEGFEKIRFENKEKMFEFAVEKSKAGFMIQ